MASSASVPRVQLVTGEALSAMLSQVLVGFTIEFDNAFEARMPHTTTLGPMAHSGRGPWLISLAMWANLLSLVDGDGRAVRELRSAIEITNLNGLVRWGYLRIEAAPDGNKANAKIRLTSNGHKASTVLHSLADEIEQRWGERHGAPAMARLKEALYAVASSQPVGRPHYLPVLGYGLMLDARTSYADAALYGVATLESPLPRLLSQVLLALMLDYQHVAKRSLCIDANVLAALDNQGIASRTLTDVTGLGAAPIAMALKMLGTLIQVDSAPGSRSKRIRLTGHGMVAKKAYQRRLAGLMERWRDAHGSSIEQLSAALAAVGADHTDHGRALLATIPAYQEGWRAALKTAPVLPNCPAVLHRGGYPDGA